MIHYLAANVNLTPPTNLTWLWFVVGFVIGVIVRGKF